MRRLRSSVSKPALTATVQDVPRAIFRRARKAPFEGTGSVFDMLRAQLPPHPCLQNQQPGCRVEGLWVFVGEVRCRTIQLSQTFLGRLAAMSMGVDGRPEIGCSAAEASTSPVDSSLAVEDIRITYSLEKGHIRPNTSLFYIYEPANMLTLSVRSIYQVSISSILSPRS